MIDLNILALYGLVLVGAFAIAGWAMYINRGKPASEHHHPAPGE